MIRTLVEDDTPRTPVGKRLRIIRTDKKMSLEEAARRLGVSRATLFRWEIGIVKPKRWEVLADLAEVYETTITRILGGLTPAEMRDTVPS